MINAIRKRKAELDAGINNPAVDKARKDAIQSIKNDLSRKNLVREELDKRHQGYEETINKLPSVAKIRAFRDRVLEDIWQKSRKNNYQTRNFNFNEDINTEKNTKNDFSLETRQLSSEKDFSKQKFAKGQDSASF